MRKGEITRQFIIERAAPVFNRNGYGRASLADLMLATGLEKGGIYRHFASKEELACQAFDYAFELATESKFTPLVELENGLAKLEALIRNFSGGRSSVAGGCPVYNTAVENDDGNPALKKRAHKALQTWLNLTKGFAEEAKSQGLLKKTTDSAALAAFLISALEGAVIASTLMNQPQLRADVAAELHAYLKTKCQDSKYKMGQSPKKTGGSTTAKKPVVHPPRTEGRR